MDLPTTAAAVALLGLMAYAVLAGADFGGGIWDLLAAGPRRTLQRQAIAHAMGPVWEANHVWMIFVLVTLFTCFPRGYATLGIALFLPFHLALLGIMLRGAAFAFRGHEARPRGRAAAAWGRIFGAASAISPLLLGAAFGAVTEGSVRVDAAGPARWLTPYAVACGALALCTCAYLAAVYLVAETSGDLREDFRSRAILAGTATAGLAVATLLLASRQAPWFFHRLTAAPAARIVLLAGLGLFAASAYTVFSRRYRAARVCAAAEVAVLLVGWGLAYHPYFLYPDLTLAAAAAPAPTLRFMLLAVPAGALLLLPSLYLLFRVFK